VFIKMLAVRQCVSYYANSCTKLTPRKFSNGEAVSAGGSCAVNPVGMCRKSKIGSDLAFKNKTIQKFVQSAIEIKSDKK